MRDSIQNFEQLIGRSTKKFTRGDSAVSAFFSNVGSSLVITTVNQNDWVMKSFNTMCEHPTSQVLLKNLNNWAFSWDSISCH